MVHRFDHHQHHSTNRASGQPGYVVYPPRGAEAVDMNRVGVFGAKPTARRSHEPQACPWERPHPLMSNTTVLAQ